MAGEAVFHLRLNYVGRSLFVPDANVGYLAVEIVVRFDGGTDGQLFGGEMEGGIEVVGGFLGQVPYSDPFPVVAELGATWDPMGNAMTQILEGVSSPADALAEAVQTINTANGK